MNITQLTVVNACLASMGEEPINSLGDDNAFVNSAKFALEQANINEQSLGWYFNTETLTIYPHSVDGFYYLPSDILDFHKNELNPSWAVLRGTRVYDKDKAEYYTGTAPLKLSILRLLAFEELPIMARRLVKAAAVTIFQQSYDGDNLKIQEAQAEYGTAFAFLKTQHIKAVGANFLPSRGVPVGRYRRLPT